MSKRQILFLVAFLIVSISSIFKYYANKPTKMIYYLKDNETVQMAAEKFNVKVENIKIDGRYLMFVK